MPVLMRATCETLSFLRPSSELCSLAVAAEIYDGVLLSTATLVAGQSTKRLGPGPAVVVAGLPRTGTTSRQIQHGSSGLHALQGFEYAAPHLSGDRSRRRRASVMHVSERYGTLRTIAPRVHRLHPLGPLKPEECTPLMRIGGPYVPWWFMCPAPGILQHLAAQSHQEFYELIWQSFYATYPACMGPFVAKSPLHFVAYEDLFRVLNQDSSVEHVLRDAPGHLASLVDLVASTREGLGQRPCDRIEILHEWAALLYSVLPRAEQAFKSRARTVTVNLASLPSTQSRASRASGAHALDSHILSVADELTSSFPSFFACR